MTEKWEIKMGWKVEQASFDKPNGSLGLELGWHSSEDKGTFLKVINIKPDGPPEVTSALRAGDELICVNGAVVGDLTNAQKLFKKVMPGGRMDIELLRWSGLGSPDVKPDPESAVGEPTPDGGRVGQVLSLPAMAAYYETRAATPEGKADKDLKKVLGRIKACLGYGQRLERVRVEKAEKMGLKLEVEQVKGADFIRVLEVLDAAPPAVQELFCPGDTLVIGVGAGAGPANGGSLAEDSAQSQSPLLPAAVGDKVDLLVVKPFDPKLDCLLPKKWGAAWATAPGPLGDRAAVPDSLLWALGDPADAGLSAAATAALERAQVARAVVEPTATYKAVRALGHPEFRRLAKAQAMKVFKSILGNIQATDFQAVASPAAARKTPGRPPRAAVAPSGSGELGSALPALAAPTVAPGISSRKVERIKCPHCGIMSLNAEAFTLHLRFCAKNPEGPPLECTGCQQRFLAREMPLHKRDCLPHRVVEGNLRFDFLSDLHFCALQPEETSDDELFAAARNDRFARHKDSQQRLPGLRADLRDRDKLRKARATAWAVYRLREHIRSHLARSAAYHQDAAYRAQLRAGALSLDHLLNVDEELDHEAPLPGADFVPKAAAPADEDGGDADDEAEAAPAGIAGGVARLTPEEKWALFAQKHEKDAAERRAFREAEARVEANRKRKRDLGLKKTTAQRMFYEERRAAAEAQGQPRLTQKELNGFWRALTTEEKNNYKEKADKNNQEVDSLETEMPPEFRPKPEGSNRNQIVDDFLDSTIMDV